MKFTDLATEDSGTMLVLVTTTGAERSFSLTRCTSQGEPLEHIEMLDVPAALRSGCGPLTLYCQEGMITIVDREAGTMAAFDPNGRFVHTRQFKADACTVTNGGELTSPLTENLAAGSMATRLLTGLRGWLGMVTKPSSARNGNDSVKSSFSRNGLLISGVNNKVTDQY